MQDRSQAGISRWGVAAAIAAGGAGAVALASWLGARLSGPANSMIEARSGATPGGMAKSSIR